MKKHLILAVLSLSTLLTAMDLQKAAGKKKLHAGSTRSAPLTSSSALAPAAASSSSTSSTSTTAAATSLLSTALQETISSGNTTTLGHILSTTATKNPAALQTLISAGESGGENLLITWINQTTWSSNVKATLDTVVHLIPTIAYAGMICVTDFENNTAALPVVIVAGVLQAPSLAKLIYDIATKNTAAIAQDMTDIVTSTTDTLSSESPNSSTQATTGSSTPSNAGSPKTQSKKRNPSDDEDDGLV